MIYAIHENKMQHINVKIWNACLHILQLLAFQMPCVFPDTGLSVAYTSVNKTVFPEKSKNCMSIKITTEGFSSFSFLSHNVESDLPEQHKKKQFA